MSYTQVQFDQELQKMLKEARDAGKGLVCVLSKRLHDRVVHTRDNRMPMTCKAMWKLWKKQGSRTDRITNTTPSGESTTIEIEFDTS